MIYGWMLSHQDWCTALQTGLPKKEIDERISASQNCIHSKWLCTFIFYCLSPISTAGAIK